MTKSRSKLTTGSAYALTAWPPTTQKRMPWSVRRAMSRSRNSTLSAITIFQKARARMFSVGNGLNQRGHYSGSGSFWEHITPGGSRESGAVAADGICPLGLGRLGRPDMPPPAAGAQRPHVDIAGRVGLSHGEQLEGGLGE